jgi:PhnB protein
MMHIHTHLHFDGRCREAFDLYADTLGGKLALAVTFDQTPMADRTTEAWRSKIAHARLEVGDSVLLGTDAPPDRYQTPRGSDIMLSVDTPAEAARIFAVLSEQGTVGMPLAETFWARSFGTCTDRFGISWMINCEKPKEAWGTR